jgi:hypothetical protein
MMLSYSKEHKCWVGPFLMAAVNASCVRRSLVLNKYNEKGITYSEACVYPNFFAGAVSVIGYMVLGSCLMVSISVC